MAFFARAVLIKQSDILETLSIILDHLERNMRKDELVGMLQLQGNSIKILIEKVKKLESKNDSLEKNLTARLEDLENRSEFIDEDLDCIHRALDAV